MHSILTIYIRQFLVCLQTTKEEAEGAGEAGGGAYEQKLII